MVAAYGGAGAHVGNGWVGPSLGQCPAGIDAKSGDDDPLRQVQIGSGNAQGPAQMTAGDHGAGEHMGVAQEGVRFGHAPLGQQFPDIGGGNTNAGHFLFRHHGAGQALLLAVILQKGGRSGALGPEPKVLPADEAPGAEVPAQLLQKVLPGGRLHFLIKRQGHDSIHAVISK